MQNFNKNKNNVEKNQKSKGYKQKENVNYRFYNSDKMKKDVTRKGNQKSRKKYSTIYKRSKRMRVY